MKRPSATILLDANVLIALLVDDHVHHDAAETWFSTSSGRLATCPSTEGSLKTRVAHGYCSRHLAADACP